ncbi:cytochrome P450 [Nocardia sp. NPDC060256]|uniref:cytochrome P450 n=1 Tax=unclassified Nocardia TaxID=2637762 RepID=UPI00365AC891
MTTAHITDLGPLPDFLDKHDDADMLAIPTPGGTAWLVRDYSLARRVLADQRFSRAAAAAPGNTKAADVQPTAASMMSMDGAEHLRLRRVLTGAFSPKRMTALTPSIEALADRYLDSMIAAGPVVDLIAHVATPMPLSVLCTLLGVPREDHTLFKDWVDVLFDLSVSTPREKARRRLEISAYMSDLITAKRGTTDEDVLMDMILAHDEGRMSVSELLTMGLTLLMAGYQTTVGQIGVAVHALLSNRTAYEALLNDPGLLDGTVDELIRLTPSTPLAFIRVAVEPLPLGSVEVAAGDTVIVSLLHGNRDGAAFPDPLQLHPDRDGNGHLTFGYGPHRCLGATLARLQLRIVLDRLLNRLPRLRIADCPDAVVWMDGMAVRGLSQFLVEW